MAHSGLDKLRPRGPICGPAPPIKKINGCTPFSFPYLLSQMTAFRSRWLVGSSSISKVGSMNRALRVWGERQRGATGDSGKPLISSQQVRSGLPGKRNSHPPTSREPFGGSVLHLGGKRQASQYSSGLGLGCRSSDRPQLFINLTKEGTAG